MYVYCVHEKPHIHIFFFINISVSNVEVLDIFYMFLFFSVLFNYGIKLSTQIGKLENTVFEYQL